MSVTRNRPLVPETARAQPLWVRRCAWGMLLCLLGFAGLFAVAMAVYPGGNWLDPETPGHRFFANFLCDLTQPVSLSGVKNSLGAGLAQAGMLFFAAALAGFFGVVPQHFAHGSRAARRVRGLGVCAVLFLVAVPLMPSERFGRAHALLALAAGAVGIAAALCVVGALFVAQRRTLAILGALSLATAAFSALLFAYYFCSGGRLPLLVPASQKVAALLVSGWIAAAAAVVLLQPKESRHDVGTPSSSNPPSTVP